MEENPRCPVCRRITKFIRNYQLAGVLGRKFDEDLPLESNEIVTFANVVNNGNFIVHQMKGEISVGDHIEYYSNGTICQMFSMETRDGPLVRFHRNGETELITFCSGAPTGDFVGTFYLYYDTGQIHSIGEIKDGVAHGVILHYYSDETCVVIFLEDYEIVEREYCFE